ncbi:MAG TPA: outer membrane beta-barrel protein [Kofleriaceae bacterium]|nr:outer membrane beta-barrel protein [Kofleriaceae bacterium]
MSRSAVVALAAGCVLAGAGRAAADRPAATGWYAEGGLGAVTFVGKVFHDANPGPALDLHVGRDLFSWLSVGVVVAASSHEATVPAPPKGEWFQLYRGAAEARIAGRLDRIGGFVEGGAGLTMISSNILQKVGVTDPGEHFSIAFHAGAGVEYQLENRHYAIGLAGDGVLVPQFDAMRAIAGRLYLRYTY